MCARGKNVSGENLQCPDCLYFAVDHLWLHQHVGRLLVLLEVLHFSDYVQLNSDIVLGNSSRCSDSWWLILLGADTCGTGTAALGIFSAMCTKVQWSWEGNAGMQVPGAEVQTCESGLHAIGMNVDNVFDELC